MEQGYLIQGRRLIEPDLAQVRCLIEAHPSWSRRRISKELAQTWNWRNGAGQLKDMAARSLLLKLEQRGLLVLPSRRCKPPRRFPPAAVPSHNDPAPIAFSAPLAKLQPLRLDVVTVGGLDHALFSRHLARYHYLGYRGPVGENVAYLARDRYGRDLACVLFGAAAWKAQARDRWIGWDAATRARRLPLVANNSRFLILPWVRVPHLASHLLGSITRRLAADWQAKYGHPICLAETFVECSRFRGTCYCAANWTCVGQTQGRSRQDRYGTLRVPVKDIYLYPLTPRFREELCRVEA
ncbi:MAG: Druantia anti-phage system protein DruA [Nitrospiraceae bacterium]